MCSIRRTRTGDMILELKRNKERKGAAYKNLAEEVLGEGVEMKALTAETTLKVKNLYEVVKAQKLVTALRQQRDVQVGGHLSHSATAGAGGDTGSLGSATSGGRIQVRYSRDKVGWCAYHLTFLEPGHKSRYFKSPDRSKLCTDAAPKAIKHKAARIHSFV